MKPLAFAAATPTVFRRFVRILALFVPAFVTSVSFAEIWTGTDIGNTGAAGHNGVPDREFPPTFSLAGSGADIQGTADSFRFMHTPLSGDAVLVTRVTYLANTHPWAKAGVMIRASLAPNSANVAMLLSPAQACSFQVRPAAGSTTEVTLGPWLSPPYYVKLTRVGATFTGYVSPDGTTWTQVGSRTVAMPAQVYVGFPVCSHQAGTLTGADFARADVNGSSVPPASPSNLHASNLTHQGVTLTWTDNSDTEDAFIIRVQDMDTPHSDPYIATRTGANVTTAGLGLSPSRSYYISVMAVRGGAESGVASISVRTPPDPNAPPAAPDLISVEARPHNLIWVSWPDRSDTETGFEIERAIADGPFTLVGTTGVNANGFEDANVTDQTTYSYRVRAKNAGGYSAYSPVGSVKAEAIPATPTGLAIDAPTGTTLRLTWTDNSTNEQGFIIHRSTAGGQFVQLQPNLAANTTSYTDTGLTPGTAYSYMVLAYNTFYSDNSNVATASTTTGDSGPLPMAWTGLDVGAPALTGSESGLPPAFTMQAAGSDIYGTADSFRFMAETVTGDATVVARVVSMTNTHPWAKAGVMIRGSLAAGSANAAMVLSPAQVCSFQARATTGAATDVVPGPWVTPTYWVKLTRLGNTFTGYVSPDGATWTQVGSREVVLPTQVYIGFAGCSHNPGSRTTVMFDHADANGSAPPPAEPTWTQRNWGTATGSFTLGQAGTAASNEPVSITATSGDIYDGADSGVFVYQSWTGAAIFISRIGSVGASDGWAKAGLMFRAGLEPTAANAFVALTPEAGAVFQSRPATNGSYTTTINHSWTPGPGSLLKLVRGGGTISAFFSTNNGTTWTSLGSVTDDLPETIYLGYAAASHNPYAPTTATFSRPE